MLKQCHRQLLKLFTELYRKRSTSKIRENNPQTLAITDLQFYK